MAALDLQGRTSLRKTVFGNTGRFSRDIDLLTLDPDPPKPEDELLDGLENFTRVRLR
jgi:predicted nucleotidyltransferase component of viral defense system